MDGSARFRRLPPASPVQIRLDFARLQLDPFLQLELRPLDRRDGLEMPVDDRRADREQYERNVEVRELVAVVVYPTHPPGQVVRVEKQREDQRREKQPERPSARALL